MIPEQQQSASTATASDPSLTMTGSSAGDAASAAVPDGESPDPSPAKHSAPVPQCKPLKSLLKTSPPSGEKSRKRVKFSETLLVFCDDWPEELMPQIIALKSPSDFSLVEVAAQGYMFEPPVEYQDCMSFDPPPDYRDLSHGVAAGGEPDAFAFIDSAEETSVYWQSVIMNEKENLEEDAIIGVLKEDAILQAIGQRHSAVFQPPVTDVTLSQEDFPIHYSAQLANQSSLSPSSSTSSLHEPNQRQASTDHEKAEQTFFLIQSSPQNGFSLAEEEPPSIASPAESVHDPASDSSFTSQDTIIVMTKEILKGNMSPFEENMDEDITCPEHKAGDVTCSHCDENDVRSCTPASDDSSSIGRFRIVSCPDDDAPTTPTPVPTENLVRNSGSPELSKEVTTDETKVQPESEPRCMKEESPCRSTCSASPIDSNIGRFHVVNYSQELSIEPVLPLPADAPCPPNKKAPPPPPAKPPLAVVRQRMASLNEDFVFTERKSQTTECVDCKASPPLPTRSGSVPNALVSVSAIRRAFERRGNSLEEQCSPNPGDSESNVRTLEGEKASFMHETSSRPDDGSANHRLVSTGDASATELPAVTREQRPKSFPSDSSCTVIGELAHFSSLNRTEQSVTRKSLPESTSTGTNTLPSQVPSLSTDQAKSKETSRCEVISQSSGPKNDISESKSEGELIEYTEEPRTLVPSKRTSSLANFHQLSAAVCSQPPPSHTRVMHPQPVYLSLNRRDPHQLLTLCNSYCASETGFDSVRPPVRTAASSVPGPPLPPPRPIRDPNQLSDRPNAAGPAARPSPALFPSQQLIQTPAGLVSPSAIYGYIRNCSAQAGTGDHVHYHHPQLLLQAASQRLSSCQNFPPPNEIRRRDGINAFPQVWQEAPAPGKFPVSSVPDHNDELEQFVQQEQDRTERIKQRYGLNEEENSDDPTFGFSKRPAVRGIRTQDPRSACIATTCAGGQVFVQPVGLAYPQHRLAQLYQQSSPQTITPQQPAPPSRHVYLVRAPHYSTIVPLGATLPRGGPGTSILRCAVPQQTVTMNERPASSLGPPQQDVHAGCPQCSLIQQRQRMETKIEVGPEQVGYPVRVPNGTSLTYKTISMPNVAMIRPLGLLSMAPSQRTNDTSQPSSSDSAAQSRTSTLSTTISASAALSAMTAFKPQMHNNNPDLVIDATMSRTSGPKSTPVASSSPMPSGSSITSSSSLLQCASTPFLKKKEGKSKEEKKKSKKEKEKKKQTKDGQIYYSMNL